MTDNNPMVVANPLAPFEREGALKVVAPAKVNLFLGVGSLRDDGRHEVQTIMHALSLHDIIRVDYEARSEGGLSVSAVCHMRGGLPELDLPSENNLAVKAICLLAKALGRSVDETITLSIEKHIPAQAGLGGGSSNAAAALVAASHLWGLDAQQGVVLEVAQQLGADVAFFLEGGCAMYGGAGDELRHSLTPSQMSLVLIKPEIGVSTALAYQTFDNNPIDVPVEYARKASEAQDAREVPLFNNLQPVAEKLVPELATIRSWAENQPGVSQTLLCGSGSTIAVFCESFAQATRLSAQAQQQGWWTRCTTGSSLRAAVVPRRTW